MSVAERRVEADIGELAASHVFLFRSDVREYDAIGRHASTGGVLQHVGLADLRELEEPEDGVGNGFEDVEPAVERGGVDFVELTEVAVHDCVLGKTVAGA